MSKQAFRHPEGGTIDRSRPLRFSFDGRTMEGYAGDTLASALLANGVRIVGRSYKYHRPRGVFGAGVEEPNALVQLRTGDRQEPNQRATQVELRDGLRATSQNRWPSLEYDLGGINNLASKLIPAGFYYKTFMWPHTWWMRYEHFIRRAAGLGEASREPDPDHYAKRFAHCDVLVVGGGPSGLMAATGAARAGARVILVDDNPVLGGSLRGARTEVDDGPAAAWVTKMTGALEALPNVRLLKRATAFGYYDDNLVAVAELVSDHLSEPVPTRPRQRIWWVRARRVVLATGAIERPLVFAGNDVPGVMLASAVRRYADQYAVRCGTRAVIFTNNDSAYATLDALKQVGVEVAAVIDTRRAGPTHIDPDLAGTEFLAGHAVVGSRGSKAVAAVTVMALDGDRVAGASRRIECDLLCVSGGWNPTAHLYSQSQGRLSYDPDITAFVPRESVQEEQSAGACRGTFPLGECLREGLEAGLQAARYGGCTADVDVDLPSVGDDPYSIESSAIESSAIEPSWSIPLPRGHSGKRFVDIQNDVTVEDIELAAREGYQSVEHLKRYTTLGMGTDQGRTSNVNGLAILARTRGTDIPGVGTTTFRPPFSPVSLGALAADETGTHFAPLRRSPMHDWHLRHGARMVNAGLWQRAQFYPQPGEEMMPAIWRETTHVRNQVGIVDVSTLGKIEVRGRDAAEFLERVYINRWRSLGVGRCRYGLMLREDGFVFDDGTSTRIGENEYYMTTTTANAGPVMAHLEFYAQTVWPELHVHLTSVTDQWGGLALAGPHARDVLAAAVDDTGVGDEALPFMGYMETTIARLPVRIFRITFSGELAYEVHMPADFGAAVWQAVVDAGASWGIAPYGTEALGILRIEKGHVVGAELDGRTLPADFGFARMQKDTDFIGRRSLERPALQAEQRRRLVGLVSQDDKPIPRGAQLVRDPHAPAPVPMLGHVTSQCYSPNLEQYIALALIDDADEHRDRPLFASSPLTDRHAPVKVTHHVFIDPDGERARG